MKLETDINMGNGFKCMLWLLNYFVFKETNPSIHLPMPTQKESRLDVTVGINGYNYRDVI